MAGPFGWSLWRGIDIFIHRSSFVFFFSILWISTSLFHLLNCFAWYYLRPASSHLLFSPVHLLWSKQPTTEEACIWPCLTCPYRFLNQLALGKVGRYKIHIIHRQLLLISSARQPSLPLFLVPPSSPECMRGLFTNLYLLARWAK